MANHCEKIVKRLTDKYFKPTTNPLVPSLTKSSKNLENNLFQKKKKLILNLNQKSKNYFKKFFSIALSDNEDNETGDNLTLQEKVKLTDSIRKLSNKGLSSVIK